MGNDPWLAALPEHWPWQGLQNGVRPEARLSESCSPGDRLGFHAGRTPYEIPLGSPGAHSDFRPTRSTASSLPDASLGTQGAANGSGVYRHARPPSPSVSIAASQMSGRLRHFTSINFCDCGSCSRVSADRRSRSPFLRRTTWHCHRRRRARKEVATT